MASPRYERRTVFAYRFGKNLLKIVTDFASLAKGNIARSEAKWGNRAGNNGYSD